MNNIALTTKRGYKITTASNEDTAEPDNIDKVLKDPIIYDSEGFDETKLKACMNKEMESIKNHQVFTGVNIHNIPPEDRKNLIQSRWVHREKGTEVRSKIVAKGYNEVVSDLDDIYASTPIFSILRYTDKNIVWTLHKAMYGLRTSPKAWQEHLAQVLKT